MTFSDDVYIGIVGWIYRTKIDPISILLVSLLFEQWSSLHLFSFHEMLFPLSYIEVLNVFC